MAHPFNLVETPLSLTYGIVFAALILLYVAKISSFKQRCLDRIPTIGGPSYPVFSYIGAFRFVRGAKALVQQGYSRYRGGVFKIARPDRWLVVVTGSKLMEEFRTAPDDVLSFVEATNDTLAISYTLGPNIRENEYHIGIIRGQLTRNLGYAFDGMHDEVVAAFGDEIRPQGNEWVAVPALDAMSVVVCRASNRAFVGLPLCRKREYVDLCIGFTIDVALGAFIINMFPTFLRPLVGSILTRVPKAIKKGVEHLGPVIEDRIEKMQENGKDWAQKPKDMITWLIEEAQGEERSVRNWALRILTVNFAAIHTSSTSFTHALFHLAANPQFIQPLREEVEDIVNKEGWSRASLQKMRRIDSFLKESMRYNGMGCLSMTRKALKPFTFSDGTVIPPGVYVNAAQTATHHDEEYYADPDVFDGLRFAEEEGQNMKHHLISTANDYVPFGHGKHACPGRFFAANTMKTMLAHLVLTYDVKMENEGVRPPDRWFGPASGPNATAKVLFRKRQL
ncbi:cytochrome P450 [Neolentinus lepideus HHB14362 ss-1]|uniref:Cytochrome P450 n=1 Tax=Neolentinus lepideus HHB14362 ss-1 TaxID=1314782 RepID=A0A165W734_9AGAM|nr:cytochrome P450 [Neolentinus lepideus HHB14362 ss-1]